MCDIAFITPSYRGDIDRFSLLRQSMEKFYYGEAKHLVVVPEEDYKIFRPFTDNKKVEILKQNDFISPFFYSSWWYRLLTSILPSQEWRFKDYAGRLGWIKQQIVKLSAPDFTDKQVLVFIDSDVVFLRKFNDSNFLSDQGYILLRREPETESGKQRKSIQKARELLFLPSGSTEHHYMGHPNIWYRDWLLAMREYIEEKHQVFWQNVLYDAEHFSEYSLYGIFVEEVLKPENLVSKTIPFHIAIWDDESFENFESSFHKYSETRNIPLCVLVQSNLDRDVDEYFERIKKLWSVVNN